MFELGKLDEVKFNDFCLINFYEIQELELKFEDNINIDSLLKVSYYQNIKILSLSGKIKDISIFLNLI